MGLFRYFAIVTAGVASLGSASPLLAQAATSSKLGDYLMQRDAELTLATSAAPPNITRQATFKVLTERGYQVAREGTNGFVCLVLRSWGAPTFGPAEVQRAVFGYPGLRAPICYDPVAARTVLPYQELRARLGLGGKTPAEIARAVSEAYASGALHPMERVSFAYMLSADQDLGPGAGAFHPHVMVFAPYYDNAMLGGNAFGGTLAFVSDDPGTPFAVVVIPVEDAHAIKAAGVKPGGTQ